MTTGLACCPNCGIDFEKRVDLKQGDLTVNLYGDTEWKGRHVRLTTGESLIVHALARQPGTFHTVDALLNIIGSASESGNTISVMLCRIRAKFRLVDPGFDQIETGKGPWNRGARWRV